MKDPLGMIGNYQTFITGLEARTSWPRNGMDIRKADFLWREGLANLFILFGKLIGMWIVLQVILSQVARST